MHTTARDERDPPCNFMSYLLNWTLAILSRQEGEISLTIDELCQSSPYRRRPSHATPARSDHTGLGVFCTTVFHSDLEARATVAARSHPDPWCPYRHGRS